MNQRQRTGRQGEAIATEYLLAQGCTILETNWHAAAAEIDIVCRCQDTLVFVEVRTSRTGDVTKALSSLTPGKQTRLVRSVYAYLDAYQTPEGQNWRIDVIAVALQSDGKPIIEHVEDALGW
ncbi:MAG: YraN family protein [Chloroflexota bacterium]